MSHAREVTCQLGTVTCAHVRLKLTNFRVHQDVRQSVLTLVACVWRSSFAEFLDLMSRLDRVWRRCGSPTPQCGRAPQASQSHHGGRAFLPCTTTICPG